ATENIIELVIRRGTPEIIAFDRIKREQSAGCTKYHNSRKPVVPMSEPGWKSPDVLLIAQNIREHELPGDRTVKRWHGAPRRGRFRSVRRSSLGRSPPG